MSTNYRFKPVVQREDTAEIKHKCYVDSVPTKETGDSWNTLYNDTYVRHPLATRTKVGAPAEGICIGGGNLSPTKDEMTSNYQQFFKGFDRTDVPPRAEPLPPSDFIPYDGATPQYSTSQEAMKLAIDNRPPYDNTAAKQRAADSHQTHLFLPERTHFDTTYSDDFGAAAKRIPGRPPVVDNKLQKSSVTFDSKAGLGPHTRSAEKKGTFPEIGDAPRPDHLKINYDVGYSRPEYVTSSQSSFIPQNGKRPTAFKAPICATLADHGTTEPWKTLYETDFQCKKGDTAKIDLMDLRKTHWDSGHETTDYSRQSMAVSTHVPEKQTIDLQGSNAVFQGDGEMRWRTTAKDLEGKLDRSEEGRGKFIDARDDHLFLGGDKLNYQSTAKDANKMAGKGKPAQMSENLYRAKAVGFARGGYWDPNSGYDNVDEKPPRGQPETAKIDKGELTRTHFTLDATSSNKSRFKTTYFEEICRPKLAE